MILVGCHNVDAQSSQHTQSNLVARLLESVLKFYRWHGSGLDLSIRKQIVENLKNFKVEIHVIHISKSPFNANKGNWRPVEYSWLDNLVFSKAGYV